MKPPLLLLVFRSRVFATVCYVGLAASLAAVFYFQVMRPNRRYGELNMSCFLYRDLNRNGIYDQGDRPYAGGEVGMVRPGGGRVTTTSNTSGFANFTMSASGRDAAIHTTGLFSIEVMPPAGWVITSGNEKQSATFRKLAEAPVGIVTDRVFLPVGIAPVLTISGSISGTGKSSPPPGSRLTVRSPKGEQATVALTAVGHFSFPATPGTWTFEYRSEANASPIARPVLVQDYPAVVSAFGSTLEPPSAGTTLHTVGFDTLTTSDTVMEVPNGYGGLNWFGWVTIHQKTPDGSGFVNGACSEEYVAYCSSGHPASISSAQPFDFVGAKLTMAWVKGEPYEVVVKAWNGDTLLHEDRLRLTVSGPIQFAADYRSITRVEIASTAYWQVVLEDVVYRLP